MPIVKVQTFHKGGHHATCKERRAYLEQDGRHLCRDTLNVTRPESWDRELDTSRTAYSLRGDVTYREYVLSPSEDDHATPSQMRELAWEWALSNFPENEVVIILHDDNRGRMRHGLEGIVHAHVVVNSIDLERGRKMSLSNERVRELHNSVQAIAERLGLSRIDDYRPGERLRSQQAHPKTHEERQLEIRGADAWKSVMRDMAIQAKEQSHSFREFQGCLRMADIDMEVRGSRVYLVDRDDASRAVRADKLDRSLSARELSRTFAASLGQECERRGRTQGKRLEAVLRREIERGNQDAGSERKRKARIAEMRKDKAHTRKQTKAPRQMERVRDGGPREKITPKSREEIRPTPLKERAEARVEHETLRDEMGRGR